MKCDSWASLLARTFASPCLGYEPKAKVATITILYKKVFLNTSNYNKLYQYILNGDT
jgi:hypothetical protein